MDTGWRFVRNATSPFQRFKRRIIFELAAAFSFRGENLRSTDGDTKYEPCNAVKRHPFEGFFIRKMHPFVTSLPIGSKIPAKKCFPPLTNRSNLFHFLTHPRD